MRKNHNSFWNKRIPTFFGLFFLIVGIGATTYLAESGVIPFLKASPTENPENIRITNITDSSFTITYTTVQSLIGSAVVSKDTSVDSGQVYLDDRDQSTGSPLPHSIHSITVRELQPKTQYYFAINSGKTTFLNNNNPFTVTTGASITQTPSSEDPLSGRVILPNGNIPQEALIYATTNGAQTISTLVKPSGIYILPLNTLRTIDFSSPASLNSSTTFQVLVVGLEGESRIIVSATQRNPVPTITLSSNYDFTVDLTPLASSSAVPTGFPVFALDTSIQITPKIDTPVDNQSFTDAQPILKGKAIPGETVEITIHSAETINTKVTADKYGTWTFRPTTPLSPGQHTITIITKDSFGILKTIQQTFTILQSGTQVVEAATPSGQLSPSPIPTKKPTPTPTIVVTQKPTPTPTAVQLLITPTSVQATKGGITPSAQKPLPPTGNDSVVTAGFIGIATTVAGMLLFLATRGASGL